MIVDDGSRKEYLREDIHMTRCTVIYEAEYRGRAELLPYMYFLRLRPFSRAVILHDSVFLQKRLDVEEGDLDAGKGIRFLWSIPHRFDESIYNQIHRLIDGLKRLEKHERDEVRRYYTHGKEEWLGCFGVMSIVDHSWLEALEARYHLIEDLLPLIHSRNDRSALERVFAVVAYHHQKKDVQPSLLGNIIGYIPWGGTFSQYLLQYDTYQTYPVIKVWTGR
jgi:hypothetical protein